MGIALQEQTGAQTTELRGNVLYSSMAQAHLGRVELVFLACEDFGRMFDNLFPACAFFF